MLKHCVRLATQHVLHSIRTVPCATFTRPVMSYSVEAKKRTKKIVRVKKLIEPIHETENSVSEKVTVSPQTQLYNLVLIEKYIRTNKPKTALKFFNANIHKDLNSYVRIIKYFLRWKKSTEAVQLIENMLNEQSIAETQSIETIRPHIEQLIKACKEHSALEGILTALRKKYPSDVIEYAFKDSLILVLAHTLNLPQKALEVMKRAYQSKEFPEQVYDELFAAALKICDLTTAMDIVQNHKLRVHMAPKVKMHTSLTHGNMSAGSLLALAEAAAFAKSKKESLDVFHFVEANLHDRSSRVTNMLLHYELIVQGKMKNWRRCIAILNELYEEQEFRSIHYHYNTLKKFSKNLAVAGSKNIDKFYFELKENKNTVGRRAVLHFNLVMEACYYAKDVDRMYATFEELRDEPKGSLLKPDVNSYVSVIDLVTEQNQLGLAFNLLREMHMTYNITPPVSLFVLYAKRASMASNEQLLQKCYALCEKCHPNMQGKDLARWKAHGLGTIRKNRQKLIAKRLPSNLATYASRMGL